MSGFLGLGPTTKTDTTTAIVPADVESTRTDLFNRARDYAAQPFTPYDQPRVAGFTPDQLRGFDISRNIADTSGALSALTPDLTREGVAATQDLAVRLPDMDISAYMSPYVEGVLDPAIRDLAERGDRERLRLGQQSALSGSYGGSRQAIAEAEAERGTQRSIGELSARERAAAYNSALQEIRNDQRYIPSLYKGALDLLGTGLTQNAARLTSEANPYLSIGGAQQGLEQRNLDVFRSAYEEERDDPLRGINALRGALGITSDALGTGRASTKTEPGANTLASILGGVTGAVSNAPKFIEGAKAVGGLLGFGGASALPPLSDNVGSWFLGA